MNRTLRKIVLLFCFPLLVLVLFSGFSIRSLIQSLTGTLVPQPLPKLAALPNGALSSSIEIILPPGTKGIVPALSLSYNSGGENGILGVGWDLQGIFSISRDQNFGINYDGKDRFLSDQVGALVDVSGNQSNFHSRKESWAQFIPNSVCGSGPCSWTATDKDGVTYSYGSTSDSRIEAIGRSGSIRAWALSQVRDPFGNGYNITYIEDSSNGEYYPNEITYQNRSIKFEYSDSRPDSFPSYSSGSLVKTTKRLDAIQIYADGSLIREYDFDYSIGATTGRSVLSSVKRKESNAFGSESYADLEFTYGSDGFLLQPPADTNLNSTVSNVNLFVPSGLLLYANLLFGNPLPTQPTATDKRLADYLQYAMHIPVPDRESCNSGPSACLCAAYAPCWSGNVGFFNYLASLCLDYNNWGGPTYCASGIDSGLTYWTPMDLDGNGILDFASVVGSETNNSIRLRAWTVQNGGIDPNASFLSPILPLHYNTFFQAADLDGDGRTDFAFENGGKLNVIYSQANSFSSPSSFSNVVIPAANRNMKSFAPYSYFFEHSSTNPKRMAADKAPADWFADMNSDGLADFIHYDGSNFNIYLNQKGSFANAIQIAGTSNYFINEFMDMDSDGKAEYVRLVQYSENPQYTQINAQLQAANAQADSITNEYNTESDILNTVITLGASSVSSSDFNSLTDYYLRGCGFYLSSLGIGNYSMDDIVLVPNSNGENVACLNSDPNYIDITLLQAALVGTPIPVPNTLSDDLQLVYAGTIGPVTSTQTDLQNQLNDLNASANGTIRYRLDVTTFDLSSKTATTVPNDLGTSADRLRSFFGDVNSDNLPDFVTVVGNQIKVSLNSSKGFAAQVASDLNADDGTKAIQFSFSDVNSDGLDDLVLYNKETQGVETYISNGAGALSYNSAFGFGQFTLNEQTTNGVYRADQGQFIIQDVNGDGSKDALLIKLWQDKTQGHVIVRNANAKSSDEDDLVAVTNGVQSENVSYSSKHLHSGAILVGSGNYPNVPDTSPGQLVTNISTNVGSGVVIGQNFEYKNARFYLGQRDIMRSLGFASVKETDQGTGFYKLSEFNQSEYRLADTPMTVSNFNVSGNLIAQTIYSGFQFPNPFGTEIAMATQVSQSSYHNGSLDLATNTSYTLDSFGFPKNQTDIAGTHITSNDISLLHDTTNWRIGRPIQLKKSVDGALVMDRKAAYNGDTVTSITLFSGSGVEQNTSYTYDPFGNPVSTTDALGNVSQIVYDPTIHVFPIQKKNALGHTEKFNYDLSLGLEISHTDPNGVISSKSYDGFGRLSKVTYRGNSDWNESYEYDNPARFNLSDLSQNQSVTKTIRDTTSGIQTTVTEYSDPFENVLRSVSDTAASGVSLITDSVYDYRTGLLVKKSNPYFTTTSPFWTEYKYEDPDLRSSGNTYTDAKGPTVTSISYLGLSVSKSVTYPDNITKSFSQTKNELGQIISTTENGKTIATTYSPNGQPSQITDPAGLSTKFVYDLAGRRTSVSDPNSGAVSYTYDILGRVTKQTDARNKSLSFIYDSIGRIKSTRTNGGETPISYTYDDTSAPNGIGRMTKVADGSGTTELQYGAQGKPIHQTKAIDGYHLITKIDYDSLGRATTITYPEGSKIHQSYSLNGNLEKVTIDSADGKSKGVSVVEYTGPLFTDGSPVFRKTAGNGIVTDVKIDLSTFQTTSQIATNKKGTTLQSLTYDYDAAGNVLKQTDLKNASRSHTYTYDLDNRLLTAKGSFGTQNYSYTPNGNLLQKGNVVFTYGDSTHANAVTKVVSGRKTIHYTYDASGNMTFRDGEAIFYDSFGKMTEYHTQHGERLRYTYDYSGNRVKSENIRTNLVTYNIDDYYEIVKDHSKTAKHTMYVKGLGGEILTQITRTNPTLITQSDELRVAGGIGNWFDPFNLCTNLTVDCSTYWKNRLTAPVDRFLAYSAFFENRIPTFAFRIGYILFFVGLLYLAYPYLLKGNELLQRMRIAGFSTPVLLVSITGTFALQDCSGLNSSNAGPWNLIPSALENTTAIGSKSSNSIDGSGVPAVGGFFYQTDRLGSTSMLTDGNGNPVSGPGRSGTSYVGYLPYGEMNVTESGGPDIFRYKFTGQILDEDTGLYYYKSRYYDPFLARFIQADDRANQGINGLNRYMYVGGNPTNSIDPNGHVNLSQAIHMFNRIVGHILGKNFHNGNSPSFQSIGHDLSHSLLGKGVTWLGRWIQKIPTLLLDAQILFLDSQFGTIYNFATGKGLPQYSFKHGAVVVENSGLGNLLHDFPVLGNGGALTPGPVIFMYKKPGDWFGRMVWNATIKHEYGHVDEFYSMNGLDFFGRVLDRPLQRNMAPYLETHADSLGGTNQYGYNIIVNRIYFLLLSSNEILGILYGIYTSQITDQSL
ncbi:hypothetical protein EHQ53_12470 [Leptospira langatensis]|uniref:Teneurin-like YD-shell domain-containing protein n=1 Tax=Leptospira langatensis TaxID=2484983 RepID=A0A5F1ZR94_9LEPT|nr:RHS repeat-associated core domain-containing protein [Leptospira langatensis]TGK02798.1 hypothetical protein EHO57_05640 [Leptospira langatensis]TGL39997.1 hypothetical protein EHQ53_12470 [Leptospira langatensis]